MGTSGTNKNDAGFCVPTANPTTGNTGNKAGDAGADTARCSHSFPACSRVLGTELVDVYAAVPTVPTVPTQIAEVSEELVASLGIPEHDPAEWRKPSAVGCGNLLAQRAVALDS